MAERRRAGRVERAVRRDLRALPRPVRQGALAELSLVQARVIDELAEVAAAASRAVRLKASAELRVTLGQLREEAARVGDGGEDAAELSTPVWSDGAAVRDAADAGPADAGAAGGGGGAAAG